MAKSKKSSHYVDNEKFYNEMVEWKKTVNEAEEMENPSLQLPNISVRIFEIAERLSHRPNFFNYPYREEMVGDGIENCPSTPVTSTQISRRIHSPTSPKSSTTPFFVESKKRRSNSTSSTR